MRTGNRSPGGTAGAFLAPHLCIMGLLIGLLGWPAPLRSAGPKTTGESPNGVRLLSVRLLPEEVRLRGKDAVQQLLVIGTYDDGLERDLTEASQFSIDDPTLAEVDARGRVKARSDGRTLLTVQASGRDLPGRAFGGTCSSQPATVSPGPSGSTTCAVVRSSLNRDAGGTISIC